MYLVKLLRLFIRIGIIIFWLNPIVEVLSSFLLLSASRFIFTCLFTIPIAAILLSLAHGVDSNFKSVELIMKGKNYDSIEVLKKGLIKYKFWFKLGLLNEDATFYNIANGYFCEGQFEESIAWLDKSSSKKTPKALKASYQSLYAFNLLHLHRDLEIAEDYLHKSMSTKESAFPELGYCYLYILQDNFVQAKEHVDRYFDKLQKQQMFYGLKVVMVVDRAMLEGIENFYLGLYYQARGDSEKAKNYLLASATSPYNSFYKREGQRIYDSIV